MSALPLSIVAIGWVGKAVLLVLAALSVWSVSIMIERKRVLDAERVSGWDAILTKIRAADWGAVRAWAAKAGGTRGGALLAALDAPHQSADSIEHAVRGYLAVRRQELERGFTVLATLGSNAPFIGLFGTVLGIIQAFGTLANSQYGTSTVMSGISEALIATAVGLFVAIPAVIAYNLFSKRLRLILSDCEAAKEIYLSRLAPRPTGG